ncbi:MAG: NusG domain II-containing protein [Clostridia bacterium]
MKLLKGDIIIVLAIIISAVIIFILMSPKTYDNNVLEIYMNGELIDTVELAEDTQMTIEIDDVAHNTIEIVGEQVRIINSTCYDHVCENTGYISKAGEVIVCMPNKLLLKIVGDETDISFDAVVG